jgi:hypothetical protein
LFALANKNADTRQSKCARAIDSAQLSASASRNIVGTSIASPLLLIVVFKMGDELYAMVNWNDTYNSTGTIALKSIISPRKDFPDYHAGMTISRAKVHPWPGTFGGEIVEISGKSTTTTT